MSAPSTTRQAQSFTRRLTVIAIVALFAALVLAACDQASVASAPLATALPTPKGPALHLRLSVERFEFNTPALMCQTPLVVDAVTQAYGQAHWNTPTGTRPDNLTNIVAERDGYNIFTPVIFSGMHILFDQRHVVPTQAWVLAGGQVRAEDERLDEYPFLSLGSRNVLIFAATQQAMVPGYSEKTLLVYSAFPIFQAADGTLMVRLQNRIVEQGRVTQQEVDIALSQLTADLASCPRSR